MAGVSPVHGTALGKPAVGATALAAKHKEWGLTLQVAVAFVLFLLSMMAVAYAWSEPLSPRTAIWLLFMSPLFAGVAGATVRLVSGAAGMGVTELLREPVIEMSCDYCNKSYAVTPEQLKGMVQES